MIFNRLEFGPLIRASKRRKFSSLLVIIQIAITMAIVTNALHIVNQRYQLVNRDSGLDEANSFYFTSSGFTDSFNPQVTINEDLAIIRSVPGVLAAVQSNSLPLTESGNFFELQTQPGEQQTQIPTANYKIDQYGLAAFDAELLAGENFSASEIIWQNEADNSWPGQVIISKATAINLSSPLEWQQMVGKTIYVDLDQPLIVKGIVDKMQAPWVEWPHIENTMFTPATVALNSAIYFIRAEPGYLPELLQSIPDILSKNNRQRVIRKLNTITQAKQKIYGADSAIINILLIITLVLSLVTSMGIAGLASFNVQKRKRQIGTRRALGASRSDILGYFMLENLLLSIVGVSIGAVITLGLNIELVNLFGLTAINWVYLPAGMLILILLGQLAVLWPATKASQISPALATRST